MSNEQRQKINFLISWMQVFNLQVRINNDNIGNFYNVHVFEFIPVKVFNKEYFNQKEILYKAIQLPENIEELFSVLIGILFSRGDLDNASKKEIEEEFGL